MRDTRLIAALGAVVLWSTNARAAEIALERTGVGWLLLVQYATAALVLGAVHVRRRRVQRRPGPAAVGLGVVGLTGTIFLQYTAFALAPVVAANVLAYGWPLLAAVWVAATRRAPAGAGLAVLGFGGVVLILVAPGSPAPAGPGAAWGYAAALGSALCMTVFTLRSGRTGTSAGEVLLPATVVGVGAAAVLVVVTGAPPPDAVGTAVAAFVGLGPMAAGYGLWAHAMGDGGAARFAPLGYATPMLSTAVLLATGAPATASTLIGVALVLVCTVGVLVVDRRTHREHPNATTGRREPIEGRR